jgi:hypothetical protein
VEIGSKYARGIIPPAYRLTHNINCGVLALVDNSCKGCDPTREFMCDS